MYLGRVGVPKTSRDTKKDCEKPGCPSDHPGQGARPWRRGDRMSATSANGTKRTWRDVCYESVMRAKADIDQNVFLRSHAKRDSKLTYLTALGMIDQPAA